MTAIEYVHLHGQSGMIERRFEQRVAAAGLDQCCRVRDRGAEPAVVRDLVPVAVNPACGVTDGAAGGDRGLIDGGLVFEFR